jgi:hypothetical protein
MIDEADYGEEGEIPNNHYGEGGEDEIFENGEEGGGEYGGEDEMDENMYGDEGNYGRESDEEDRNQREDN